MELSTNESAEDAALLNTKKFDSFTIVKKDGTLEAFNEEKIKNAITKAANRTLVKLSEQDLKFLCRDVLFKLTFLAKAEITVEEVHNTVEAVLESFDKSIADSYRNYRNYKQDFVKMLDKVYQENQRIMYIGDKENSNIDSALVSTKRSLVYNELSKELYKKFFLTVEELQAIKEGYIYIHDMSARLNCMNCCLFDISTVLKDGFEMGNIWYNEPKTLDVAFDVIGDIVLSASAQQYGGFTVPEVDKVLAPYAQKSYEIYFNDYKEAGVDDLTASKKALQKVQVDFEQGFQGWEYKFNTVASSRGDYPFITITAGLGTGDYEKMATFAMLKVRQKGQGKKENKKPVLFPKIVFLYDEELHSEGKINYDLYRAGIECSKKAMYPDWLSLTGEGYVASMYKKYKKVISPMGCVKYDETIELETGHHKIGEVVEVVDKLYENKNKMNSLMNTPAQEIELALNPWRKCKITNKKEVYVKDKKSSNWTLMFNDIFFINEIKQTKTLRTTAYALPRNGLKIKCNNEFTSLNVLLYNTSIIDWLKITYKINDVENTIQVTTDHPLPLIDGQVKRADELKVGDILIAVNHKSPKAVITNIEEVNECCRSYDVSTDTEYFNLSNDILSHNCRAFLSPWYERGGMKPADEDDKPVFVGRFNIGAVSLHLPMIYAKAKKESKDFYEVLDYYLELIRNLHRRTYDYLGEMKASTNPLAYCEGGFYGGHLGFHDKIKPLLKSATASFGITALNELQELHNGKSLVEDGEFALEVMEYINKKINEFKEQDGYLYAIYGTPAESLCYTQVLQFRKKYGIIEDVSDRLYVSNSFHCHVSEDITPIEKQDLENRFWNLLNGGKIQYVKYPISYNTKAIETLVKRAMDMGFYEGVNLSLAYCDDCGHQELQMDVCPKCGSTNLTKIERMNGYLSYSRVKGDTRLNAGKMDEIKDRKSM